MKTAIHTQDTTNVTHRSAGKRALKAGLALAAACLAATAAQANPYGGSIFNPETNQTTTIMRGHHGESRSVEHGNRMGHLEDMMQRRITSRIFGSVFDPETGYATTAVQGPNGYARSVERRNGPRRPNRWQRG